ncbi:DapH/DapD/GlmU-related protein [Bifidobacterium sp. B4114]|uniref:DapH/DapD/GlmU-related protein n=1 Tax=Bifidobacterium sp. B4114 TaxID=2817968 RepID=UPI00226BA33C|nr:DapH/DapD/GlmU-related protein [Bifidobacterium sp. B4114]
MVGPIRANWVCNTYWGGGRCYANFNLVLVDDGRIDIGDHTMFGPNVTIVTTGHAIRPDVRECSKPQFTVPVTIGRNVWIGAGAIIMSGVTIGDNTVIGAGSLVSEEIPSDVVAYGHPWKVVRPIDDHDYEYFWKDRRYWAPYDVRPFRMDQEG